MKKNILDFGMRNLYNFTKSVYKKEYLPQSIAEFEASLSRETTDGSLCMAYDFGDQTKNETAMLFFYPECCAAPPVYHKYLNSKYQKRNGINLLQLDYINFIKENTNNAGELNALLKYLKRYTESQTSIYEAIIKTNESKMSQKTAISMNAKIWYDMTKFQDEARKVAYGIRGKIIDIVMNQEITR